jgi:catechol 2,3-dioxygenase-like lactoylglutathione lyase family enzyme
VSSVIETFFVRMFRTTLRRMAAACSDRLGSVGSTGPLRVLDHVYYWVTDLDRAVAFYHDVLGLPLARRDGDEWAEFGAGETRFALHAAGPGREPRPGGATAVFEVGDLDKAKGELSAQGVVFGHEGAVESYARFASFSDPDGNTLQIIEYDPAANREGRRPIDSRP